MKIGLLSDTHGWLDDRVFIHFATCDEIWHAGDIGSVAILEKLSHFKPLRSVYGNIDGPTIRGRCPENNYFWCEGMHVLITHIAGRPPHYTPTVRQMLTRDNVDMLVCGHSHILRVGYDPQRNSLLYVNPGAAGRYGIHQVRTLLSFEIQQKQVQNMQAIELGPK